MTLWNYRIVKKRAVTSHAYYYQIYEAYYTEQISDENIKYITTEPVRPYGNSKKLLRQDLKLMKRAFKLPIIDYEELCKKKKWKEE